MEDEEKAGMAPDASAAAQRPAEAHPKPMLTVEQQIAHMKAKGITFDLVSEDDAADYLASANNYLRAASYRKLFPVHEQGARAGQFVHLDFAYLIELSSIDRMLREAFLPLAIDVEHFAKIRLLARMEAEGEDGYAVASEFLAARPRVEHGLFARAGADERHDTYTGDLIAHYLSGMPAWVLLEVADFGTFVYSQDIIDKFCILISTLSARPAAFRFSAA